MSELEAERGDLQRADEHIARARHLLDQQRAIFNQTNELGLEVEEAGNLLQAMQESLSRMEAHRLSILDRINTLSGDGSGKSK